MKMVAALCVLFIYFFAVLFWGFEIYRLCFFTSLCALFLVFSINNIPGKIILAGIDLDFFLNAFFSVLSGVLFMISTLGINGIGTKSISVNLVVLVLLGLHVNGLCGAKKLSNNELGGNR